MCGFVGIIGPNADRRMVAPMLESILSRGPDDSGMVQGPWFALGCCRLSIITLDEGHQPVSNAAGQVHLVFNGEIYNFRSIQRALCEGGSSRCESEAQVLLRCYEKYGPSFVSHLDGVFAIAVVDVGLGVCYLFRDRFGVKPLYYTSMNHGETWLFGSDVRAFFRHPGFSTDLNWAALAERKVLRFWAASHTCFKEVNQVVPGHFLELRAAPESTGASIRAGCVPHVRLNQAARAADEKMCAEGILQTCTELLRAAVAKRVRHADVYPMALSLSGGIDSSLIAALLSRTNGDEVFAVTIGDNLRCGDPKYATHVARELGLSHRLHAVTLAEFLSGLPQTVLASGGAGPSYFPYFLGRVVQQAVPGTKVILCGEGADELFLGYHLHTHPQAYVGQVLNAFQTVPPEMVDASPLLQRISAWTTMPPDKIWFDFISLFQTDQLVNGHLLPFDHGFMASGLECRVPFLDRDLVDYVQTVPASLRIVGSSPKILLRLILADLLCDRRALMEDLLHRRPSPAFLAVNRGTSWLKQLLDEKMQKSRLARSRIARFASDSVDLFWFASTVVVFLDHRGDIADMSFDDLLELTLATAVE